MTLFVNTGIKLIGMFVIARWLVGTKYGRVLQAIRNAESRVMFTGYNPVAYKLSIWTLSAVMCGHRPQSLRCYLSARRRTMRWNRPIDGV